MIKTIKAITNKGINTKAVYEFDSNKITLRQLSLLALTGTEIYIKSGKAKAVILEIDKRL